MPDNLDTAYVNHTSSTSVHQDVLADLYERRWVGIHYGDIPSLNKEEWKSDHGYTTGGNAVGRLCDYAEEGKILSASYTGHPDLDGGRLVGTIGASDENEDDDVLLIVCRNKRVEGQERGVVDYLRVKPGADISEVEAEVGGLTTEAEQVVREAIGNDGFDEDDPDYRILKGLEFNDEVEWVWNRDFPGLWAANKRQTIAGWNTGKSHLYAAYYAACESKIDDMREVKDKLPDDENDDNIEDVGLLSEGQLEVLCSQYLRRKHTEYFETLPVGGSLSGVDIVARSEENEILAQVTFTEDVEEKLRRLLSYADHSTTDQNVRFYFFGPRKGKEGLGESIAGYPIEDIYMPIKDVYDKFESDDSTIVDSSTEQVAPTSILDQLLNVDLSDDNPPSFD
ncbi:hypothetical protein [Halorubrum yunnanense]|uniref:Restriction endonuclease n=1 Tax=Halorubrum yunnanense TaxID=1526162 RepID=A0ABD5YPI6_9EURY|nr:hypothetical protein [Halorubrum yunnanense]